MPYVFRQDDLPKLDIQIDHGSDYAAWQAQLESYMSLSRLSEEVQIRIACVFPEKLSSSFKISAFLMLRKQTLQQS